MTTNTLQKMSLVKGGWVAENYSGEKSKVYSYLAVVQLICILKGEGWFVRPVFQPSALQMPRLQS